MSPIVQLVTEWDAYAASHGDASVEEFCRYYLAKEQASDDEELFEGATPPDIDSTLAKLIGRLAAMFGVYSKIALKDTPALDLDWFYYLNTAFHLGEAQKKDIIGSQFAEYSTGMDILKRLLKAGHITEREDPNDRRAKLVSVTSKGKQQLEEFYRLLYKPTLLMYYPLPDDVKRLLIQLLAPIDKKHSQILLKNRSQQIDEVLQQEFGKQRLKQIFDEMKRQLAEFNRTKQSE